MTPPLTVIVCTLDRPAEASRLLEDLVQQLHADFSVVVVDQSADPAPMRVVVEGLADARVVLERAPPCLPSARNRAMEISDSEVVLFLDDDVRLLPGALAGHLAAYADPRVGGVVGRIEERVVRPNARSTTNRIDRAGRVRTNLEGRVPGPIETLKGCNMSFRRQAIESVGGFDPGYLGTAFLEDADASTRVAMAGWQLRFEPSAAVRHLSAPRGGVRTGDPLATAMWRFHNTGVFLRRHRGALSLAGAGVVFGAIAVRTAWTTRRVASVPRLLGALGRGWLSADPWGCGD